MWWTAFKYLFVGALFAVVGVFITGDTVNFYNRSEPAQLLVLHIEQRRDTSHRSTYETHGSRYVYRPTFGLVTDARPRPKYTGDVWMRPVPHAVGDTVDGRHDRASGEMRSDAMGRQSLFIGTGAAIIGLICFVQGILMLFGIPEVFMPLRLRSGSQT